MHIKTLLNHVTKFKGFVFLDPRLCRNTNRLLIPIVPRKNSKPVCSRCGHSGPVYDHLNQREFLLPPIWNIVVVVLYTMRRVDCRHCGKIVVEQLPWATGKSPVTKQFAAFLAFWARKLSWKDTAKSFRVSWDIVADAVTWVVEWGLANRNIDMAATTILLSCTRSTNTVAACSGSAKNVRRKLCMLSVISWEHNAVKPLNLYAPICGKLILRLLLTVSVMLSMYLIDFILSVISIKLLIMCGVLRLKSLKMLANRHISKSAVKAYLFKEDFDHLWTYKSVTWANKFIDGWTRDVMRHRSLPELKKFARMIRGHQELILNYFRAKKRVLIWYSRGLQQQSKTDHQKILRFSE